MKPYIHNTAIISKTAKIGKGTKVWAFAQISDNAEIGENCVIANGVYIDRNVKIGNNVKIHNKALLYNGLIVEDNCFIGPGACFTNDKFPQFNTTRNLSGKNWRLKRGAIIGANSTILPDITIGENAIVGAGSVVTKDIPNNAVVYGNPARIQKIPAIKICGSAMSFGGNKNNSIVNTKKCLKSSASWILNSGLQARNGGFHSWFDLDANKYAYLYSEITGYGITTLLFLNKLKKAELAANWIIRESMQSCGGVRTGKGEFDNLFTFDTGMVLYGMVNLFKAAKKDEYLNASKKIADFLVHNQRKNGSMAPIYSPKTNKVIESFDKWSNQSGAYHAKIALGLVDLFEITKDNNYKNAAIELCEFALTLQDKSGRFITNIADNTTHVHPHSYAAEGLLYAGVHFRINGFIAAAQKAARWSYENLSDYGINELYNPKTSTFNDFQRSDILAQVLRLGVIFSLNLEKTKKLACLLCSYQYKNENKQDGGFLYSRNSLHLNSWCTMFALQALEFYAHKKNISSNKKIELFI